MAHAVGTTWEQGREAAASCILPLSEAAHKGSSGRIAVLGGSADYTGAPYYAATACLKSGADLAYVLTAQEAALPIKCYSPELMVSPIYKGSDFDAQEEEKDSDRAEELVQAMASKAVDKMSRLHCLVIGPGLGRSPLVFEGVKEVILQAKKQGLFLVLDADALYMLSLSAYRQLLAGYSKVVLTPNIVEYKRLRLTEDDAFAAATIIQKGLDDKIQLGGETIYTCQQKGGKKRSGGIGDVLAGTVATLVAWERIQHEDDDDDSVNLPLACWTACCFVKEATRLAYEGKGRSMTAPDVLDSLGPAIQSMTEE